MYLSILKEKIFLNFHCDLSDENLEEFIKYLRNSGFKIEVSDKFINESSFLWLDEDTYYDIIDFINEKINDL